jgi:hypothetical protein
MNKTILVLLGCFLGLCAACNLNNHNHTAEIAKMEDTLFKAFPSVNRISIEVKGDFGTEILMTFGDEDLFNAAEEERQRVTIEAALITRHIFGEKTPDKGSLIFVVEETSINPDAEKKVYAMTLEEGK